MDGKLTASPTDFHGSLYSVGNRSASLPPSPSLRRARQNLPFHCRSPTAYCSVSSAKSIVLIGFMGTGKSSVGRILEKQTGFHRFDTDEMVSSKLNMSIQEIFSKHGEEKFRAAETEALQSLTGKESAIIVTGGGVVTKAKNIDLLKRLGTVVWLDADHATLRARMDQLKDRPLLQTANPVAALSELLHARNPLYRNTADIRVDISQKEPEEIAGLILKNIRSFPIGE